MLKSFEILPNNYAQFNIFSELDEICAGYEELNRVTSRGKRLQGIVIDFADAKEAMPAPCQEDKIIIYQQLLTLLYRTANLTDPGARFHLISGRIQVEVKNAQLWPELWTYLTKKSYVIKLDRIRPEILNTVVSYSYYSLLLTSLNTYYDLLKRF